MVQDQSSAKPTERRWISPWCAWLPLLALPALVIVLTPVACPRWAFMWLLAFVIFVGCKWLTWRGMGETSAGPMRHLGYFLAWPGLDADAFLSSVPLSPARRPSLREWFFAAAKFFLGFVLLFAVARLVPGDWPAVTGWVGMIGIIFILHFGSFHLLSCAWRSVGVDAKPLMNWPILSVSVTEFWGRRWNTAFRDLTHRHLFRPLAARIGARWALFVVFVFSGLVHELVITVPAGYGYGGPTVFFLIQGLAIFVERSRFGKAIGLGKSWRGWLFACFVLVLPAPLLFQWAFIDNIVLPFMKFLQTT